MSLLNKIFALDSEDEKKISNVIELCENALDETRKLCCKYVPDDNNVWSDFNLTKNVKNLLSQDTVNFDNLATAIIDGYLETTEDTLDEMFAELGIYDVSFHGEPHTAIGECHIDITFNINETDKTYEYDNSSIEKILIDSLIKPLSRFLHKRLKYDYPPEAILQSIADGEFSFEDVCDTLDYRALSSKISNAYEKYCQK